MQNIADCFSNMLSSYNIAGWIELEMVSLPQNSLQLNLATFSDKSWPKSGVTKQFWNVCTTVG